jgi:hypothetical protein
MKSSPIPDNQLRQTVGESLNIYQGTIAMCSIFMGFVFSTLVQMLVGPVDLTYIQVWTVTLLVVALLSLLGALLSLQLTANQTIRYWRIFYPRSRARTLTVVFLPIGIACMLFAIVVMLLGKALHILAYLTLIGSIALIALSIYISTLHKNNPYRRAVAENCSGLTDIHLTDPPRPDIEPPTSGVGE